MVGLNRFQLLLLLQVLSIASSRELLKALYDYDEPLLLDEQKSMKVAETLNKERSLSKAKDETGQKDFLTDTGFNYDEDYYLDPNDEFEFIGAGQQHDQQQVVGDRPQDTFDQEQKNTVDLERVNANDESSNPCPEDLPTYRMFMRTDCVVINPVDENDKQNGKPSTPKPEQSNGDYHHHMNYLELDNNNYGGGFHGSNANSQVQQGGYGNQVVQQEYQQGQNYGKYDQGWNGESFVEPQQQQQQNQQELLEELQRLKELEQQQQLQEQQQQYGRYGKEHNGYSQQKESNYQQVGANSYEEQRHQSSHFGQEQEEPKTPNKIDSMESYWTQRPPSSSSNSQSKVRLPTSVVSAGSSSANEQKPIGTQENYQNQGTIYHPQGTIGHRPYPVVIPSNNYGGTSDGQWSVNVPISPVHKPAVPQHQGEKFSCDGKPTGFYTDYASDCRKFYRCVYGDPRVFEFLCGPGTKFHSVMHVCMHEYDIDCYRQTHSQLPVMK